MFQTELESRLKQLESYLNSLNNVDENAKSLLEQLHNEKATSSRCVGQNLALKEQLAEIQDKFVAVVSRKMRVFVLYVSSWFIYVDKWRNGTVV